MSKVYVSGGQMTNSLYDGPRRRKALTELEKLVRKGIVKGEVCKGGRVIVDESDADTILEALQKCKGLTTSHKSV